MYVVHFKLEHDAPLIQLINQDVQDVYTCEIGLTSALQGANKLVDRTDMFINLKIQEVNNKGGTKNVDCVIRMESSIFPAPS